MNTQLYRGGAILLLVFLQALGSACSPEEDSVSPATPHLRAIPAETPTFEPQIAEAVSPTCTNDARFVEDLTIPDGHLAEYGEVLDKQWSVLNAGSCDWGAGYRLIRIDDGSIMAREELALYPARAGETGVWSVLITVPDLDGAQIASWQAQSPDGSFFGDQVYVLIDVEP